MHIYGKKFIEAVLDVIKYFVKKNRKIQGNGKYYRNGSTTSIESIENIRIGNEHPMHFYEFLQYCDQDYFLSDVDSIQDPIQAFAVVGEEAIRYLERFDELIIDYEYFTYDAAVHNDPFLKLNNEEECNLELEKLCFIMILCLYKSKRSELNEYLSHPGNIEQRQIIINSIINEKSDPKIVSYIEEDNMLTSKPELIKDSQNKLAMEKLHFETSFFKKDFQSMLSVLDFWKTQQTNKSLKKKKILEEIDNYKTTIGRLKKNILELKKRNRDHELENYQLFKQTSEYSEKISEMTRKYEKTKHERKVAIENAEKNQGVLEKTIKRLVAKNSILKQTKAKLLEEAKEKSKELNENKKLLFECEEELTKSEERLKETNYQLEQRTQNMEIKLQELMKELEQKMNIEKELLLLYNNSLDKIRTLENELERMKISYENEINHVNILILKIPEYALISDTEKQYINIKDEPDYNRLMEDSIKDAIELTVEKIFFSIHHGELKRLSKTE